MRLDNTKKRNKLGLTYQRSQRDHGADQCDPVLSLLADDLGSAGFLQIAANQDENRIHLMELKNQARQPVSIGHAQDHTRKNANADISYSKFVAEG